MGSAVIASALVGAAIALPWLTLLPLHGVAAVLAHAITLVAALHGAGLVVARLSDQRTASPWLVCWWGAAAIIALSGVAIAAQVATLATHAVLVFGFAAVHTAMVGTSFAAYAARVDDGLAGPRSGWWPAAVLVALGAFTVLGAGGEPLARPFDDDGHLLAQLKRLLETGALGDPIGFPRRAQLGAQVALAAFASGAGDGFERIVEALAQILALALVLSRIRARDASAGLWGVVVIVAAFALALAPTDPLPCWTAVGLSVTLYAMLGDPDPAPALPLALTAGALIALRYELAPIAAVALGAAWWQRRTDHRRTAVLAGGAFATAFPFVLARVAAWRSVPALAHTALAAPPHAALILRLLLATAVAVPAGYILRLVVPDARGVRWAATATAVALGALVAQLTGAGAYSLRLAWPIAIAFALKLVIELARSRWAGPTTLVASLVLCVLVAEGREAPGRLRWSRRLASAATNLEALQRPPSSAGEPYGPVLAAVPAGANVAVWISEPERLDYLRHRIIDLRTPAVARLRSDPWHRGDDHLAALLAALGVRYLLVEGDDARVRRTQVEPLSRLVCVLWQAPCADALEALARDHHVIARRDNLQLVDLRP